MLKLEFSAAAQSGDALMAVAYRLIGLAACKVDRVGEQWVCELSSTAQPKAEQLSEERLRAHFLELLADENLRERVSARTDRVRDVIISLAFGAIAQSAEKPAK